MKKFLSFLLATVTCLSVAAAASCKGKSNNRNNGGVVVEIPDKNVKANISIAVPGTNENERSMIECLTDGFKEEYPNVTFSFRTIQVNTYGNNIQRLASSQALPDIIWTNSPDIYEVYGYMEPLDEYIKKSNELGHFGEAGFDNTFYTEYFDMASVGGKRYAVPRSSDCVVTFYRKDWFASAGVDMDTIRNGWTWDDMLAACAKLRTWLDGRGLSGVYCLEPNLTSWLSTSVPMLSSLGNEVINENGRNVIADGGAEETLALLREMVEKRYIPDSQTTVGSGFEQGSCAMYFQSMAISTLASKSWVKDGMLDLVTFPLIGVDNNGVKNYDNAKIGAGVAGYSISKTSANKAIAWAFLRYLLSRDGQQEMALNGLNLASIRKDLADPKTANWGSGYENLNLEAYTWGSQYKMSADFFQYTKIGAKKGIDTALKELFNDGTNMKISVDKAISNCKNAIDVAIQSAQ